MTTTFDKYFFRRYTFCWAIASLVIGGLFFAIKIDILAVFCAICSVLWFLKSLYYSAWELEIGPGELKYSRPFKKVVKISLDSLSYGINSNGSIVLYSNDVEVCRIKNEIDLVCVAMCLQSYNVKLKLPKFERFKIKPGPHIFNLYLEIFCSLLFIVALGFALNLFIVVVVFSFLIGMSLVMLISILVERLVIDNGVINDHFSQKGQIIPYEDIIEVEVIDHGTLVRIVATCDREILFDTAYLNAYYFLVLAKVKGWLKN